MDIQLRKWGNSIGFRIPHKVAESFGLHENSVIELTEAEDVLIIRKKPVVPSLDEILESLPEDFKYPSDIADFVEGSATGREQL